MTIQQVERNRSPFYKSFENQWQQVLYRQIAPLLPIIKDPNAINYIETIPIELKDIQELFLKTWIVTGRNFAKISVRENKKSTSLLYQTKGVEYDFFDKYMYDFALNEAGQRIVSIAETNREGALKIIRRALLEGEKQGMGADELGRFIQESLQKEATIMSRYYATRIARTEIVGASNRGQLVGAQSLGYNMTKSWLPFIDAHTRTFNKGPFNHAIEETVGLYDKFVKTGEPLDHPGDPNGSAGNVINCRCSMTYNVL